MDSKSLLKFAIGTILILISVFLLFREEIFTHDKKREQLQSYPVLSSELLNTIKDAGTEGNIMSFAILSTSVCSTCITNLVEINEIITNQASTISGVTVIFLDEDEKAINRFLHVTDLKLKFLNVTANSNYMNKYLLNNLQHLIFVDKLTGKVFYNVRIPTTYNPMSKKEYTIDEVLETYSLLF